MTKFEADKKKQFGLIYNKTINLASTEYGWLNMIVSGQSPS